MSGTLSMLSFFINGCVCALYLLLVIILTQRFCNFTIQLLACRWLGTAHYQNLLSIIPLLGTNFSDI